MESSLDMASRPLYSREWKANFTYAMPPNVINQVRELRIERGWTQQELAEKVGVSRQSINSIECGRYVPSLPLALQFAGTFGCTTEEIFQLEKKR